MDKTKEAISIRYIDKNLYDDLVRVAKAKGCTSDKKVELFDFIFHDYIHMHDLDEFKNPYLIKAVRQIIDSAVGDSERKLGGRLFKLSGEMAINVSVLNQIIFDYMNKFGDDEESLRMLKQYRVNAVEQMRENKLYPLTYSKLIKEEDE